MSFIPLRVHSEWSLLNGLLTIDEIVQQAAHLNLPAVALTDDQALYGAIDFVRQCRAANLQPILGADFVLHTQHTLCLLAQNMTGYANLCRLITRLQGAGDREVRLTHGLSLSDVSEHAAGLIALSDGYAASQLLDIFGRDNLYVMLPEPRPDRLELVRQLHISIVAAPDIRYLHAADAPAFDVLTAMRTGKRFTIDRDYAWPPMEELQQRFVDLPHALLNTMHIAERCAFDFPLGQYHFPTLQLPGDRTPGEELQAQVYAGAAQRYGALTGAVTDRLRKEIHVIDTLGYSPYFLVVADIVRFAREHHVPISPRGSASSSVAAYCLGIHDVDPLAHDLYFERFLSLERHDAPDIDLDLCSRRRDEVIDYVYRRYGAEHVAMICTYATLQPRSALREVGKVYGLDEARLGELAETLPRYWHPARWQQTREAQAKLIEQARTPVEQEVIAMSQRLTGRPHHLSVHPGGIVIAPGPITDLVPLQHATKGLLITQFDLKGIEHLGLVKIDLLGISALTVLADCVELIQQRQPDFRLESIPIDDAATQETLAAAQTIGCFQIESGGMRFTLRELAACTIEDLIIALALYRPGPLKGGLKDAFVRRHSGQEAPQYLHPALEPLLRETHGVILYQEQVLRIAHEVAGFSLGEADLLRRAMSKFRSAHEMAQLHERFVEGAQHVSQLDADTAEKVWDLMAAFAGYGFPKAHAAGYAALAYRLAYLKTHYPAELMTARLAVWGGYYSPRVYMSEARRLGLLVNPPHINHSAQAFTLDPLDRRTLWMGLEQVRELTNFTTRSILQARPFHSFADFLIRAQPLHGEAVNLVKCGALEGLGDPLALLRQLSSEAWHGRHSPQLSLPLGAPDLSSAQPSLPQRAAWEKEVLGYSVAVHPLDLHAGQLAQAGAVPSSAIGQHLNRPIALGGLRVSYHHVKTRTGEPMLLVDLEDQAGLYQVLWSGEPLQQSRALINQRDPMLIRGRVRRDRHGRLLVVGSEIQRLPTEAEELRPRARRGRRA